MLALFVCPWGRSRFSEGLTGEQLRRPQPTAGGARQRRHYKQQVEEQSIVGVLGAKRKEEKTESQRQEPEARARRPESKRHKARKQEARNKEQENRKHKKPET